MKLRKWFALYFGSDRNDIARRIFFTNFAIHQKIRTKNVKLIYSQHIGRSKLGVNYKRCWKEMKSRSDTKSSFLFHIHVIVLRLKESPACMFVNRRNLGHVNISQKRTVKVINGFWGIVDIISFSCFLVSSFKSCFKCRLGGRNQYFNGKKMYW
jgi:hypothetical protein